GQALCKRRRRRLRLPEASLVGWRMGRPNMAARRRQYRLDSSSAVALSPRFRIAMSTAE
ncbi:hypothetical protein Dimus_035865, partial [Dionaea muscipula]